MALKDLLTDLGSFYKDNPFAAKYKSKAGPTYALKYGFNQRSLEFGNDRPGGGSSRQPFIKTQIPSVDSNPKAETGIIGDLQRQISNRVVDLARITKFLTTPKGLIFIGKQELLSAQNPIVPGKPNRSDTLKGFYNPLLTLAQVAVSGTGLHIEKQGLLPLPLQDTEGKYEKTYLKLDKENKGRLYNLYKYKIANQKVEVHTLKLTGISTKPTNLIEYPGGPGVTETLIPFADNSVYSDGNLSKVNTPYTWTQQQLFLAEPASQTINDWTILPDFRKKISLGDVHKHVGVSGETGSVDYTNLLVNKINRVGLGDPGRRYRDRSNLYTSDLQSIDKVAAMPLYRGSIAAKEGYTRDFIRFRFEVLDNDNDDTTASLSKSTNIHFRAFLGAITDNFGGEWAATKFVGRGDNFYSYTGFTRTISLSFRVHPQTRDEMKAMYQKLTYLASTLAPDYSSKGGYMRGNIVRLVVGSYLYRIPGFITSLSYTVPEDASWEIAYNEPESGEEITQLETPRHFDVQLRFTPIHDFAPQLMDGTRDYALFTPAGTPETVSQRNPYLPRARDVTNADGKVLHKMGENIIQSSVALAEEVVGVEESTKSEKQ